jgi:hypothetical protein
VEFCPSTLANDRDLIAVDLSASGIKTLAERVFQGCLQLAGVAFPPELVSIGKSCFMACDALRLIDLATTQLKTLGASVFGGCGATHVSVPASLREIGQRCFAGVPLKVLDLRACSGVVVSPGMMCEVTELYLPREGFAEAAKAFLPGSRVGVLEADIAGEEVAELEAQLDGWGIEKLVVVSQRLPPYEWRGVSQLATPVPVTNPVTLSTAASITMTRWRKIPEDQVRFVRSLDLSGLTIGSLPEGTTLQGMTWLERAVLPGWLRVLPVCFFQGCSRLVSIGTGGCTSLEKIKNAACGCCRSLAAFDFPPSVRILSTAFGGTSMAVLDLSETAAESAEVIGLLFLEELLLPRRCVLKHAWSLPSLRRLTFGSFSGFFGCHPAEVRFESMVASSDFSPGLAEARVYGEVACELGRETIPSPPP